MPLRSFALLGLDSPATVRTTSMRLSPASRLLLFCFLAIRSSALDAAPPADAERSLFSREVRPILSQACFGCHGETKQEADLRLDRLDPDLVTGPDAETWHDVLNRLNLGEMPPKDAKPLGDRQHQKVVDWLTAELRRAAQSRQASEGRVVLRRLTRYEYANTMRDLLGLDLDYAKNLPPDSVSNEGFQNNGASLGISSLQIEMYLDAARAGLKQAIVTGEKPRVYRHRADKSEKVKRAKRQVTNRLQLGDRFLARMLDFPREGEVVIRVRASADVAADAAFPRMRIAMGLKADVKAPEKTLTEVDVTGTVENPELFEFRTRIERFPLPGHNPKFPGFQITLYHGDPSEAKRVKKNKRNKKEVEPVEPSQPAIVVHSVEFEGPTFQSWPPASHVRILFPSDSSANEEVYAREVVTRFLTRAYRRPARSDDVDLMMRYFAAVRPDQPSFEEAMREVLAMSLVSADFLYLVEPRIDDKRQQLTDYELASRLSYFLWSTMPDERLFELASTNELNSDEQLEQQVIRMLADPKAGQFVEHFTNQWFDLKALDRIAVNPEFYPDFDDALKADMRRETQLFFATILEENTSCLQLLDADFAIVNRQLAEHYGIPGPRGSRFERVALQGDEHRGGVLTQGSFLLANSNGEDSHPIKRAVWMLDRLLDNRPAPPPPDVPELDPDEPNLAGLTLKRQLEVHRTKPACNNCHRGIDPWGIAFENFDAVGRWREDSTARPKKKRAKSTATIESAAQLPDGTHIDGVDELKHYLLDQHKQQFAQAVVKRLLAYSVGRSMELSDQPAIDTLTEQFASDDFQLPKLMVAIVQSEPFQTK